MIIKKEYPPYFQEIKNMNLSDENTIFTFGDVIYNPSGKEIPDDIIFHETIHSKQQSLTTPEAWWVKYIRDPIFRLQEELEAYAKQYAVIRASYQAKASPEALDEFASNLASPMYNLSLTKHQAESLIRHKSLQV